MSSFDKNSPLSITINNNGFDLANEEGRSIVRACCELGEWDDSAATDILDKKIISKINHWLSLVPTTATTVAGNSKNLMTCSFEYSQLIQAKDGTGAIGAARKAGSNQIGAQARFQEAENLKSLVNTGLVFNIASQLVAQKHLADINERLQSIEEKIGDIQIFLEEGRQAKIKAFRESLYTISSLIREGEDISSTTLQTLAIKKGDVREVIIHIYDNVRRIQSEIESFDATSWFGSDDLRKEIQEKIKKINRFQREYLVGMQCLMMANLILYIKQDQNKEFLSTSEAYMKELSSEDGVIAQWEKTKRTVAHHLSKMRPFFEFSNSTDANVLLIEKSISKADSLLVNEINQIANLKSRFDNMQNSQVLLEMVDGVAVRGRYLNSEQKNQAARQKADD